MFRRSIHFFMPHFPKLMAIFIALGLFFSCADSHPKNLSEPVEVPLTTKVNAVNYRHVLYVARKTGNDTTGVGSRVAPYRSVKKALENINDAASQNRYAIFVSEGEYIVKPSIKMKIYVDLYGGFNEKSWTRNVQEYKSILNANLKNRVLVGADNARLDGFVVTGGAVRGKGAGIYCDGVSPTISNNVFVNNRTFKPERWHPKFWHETANDGGAIYLANGASPLIEHNLFTGNRTENGRGAGIAADNQCKPVIKDNVFFNNIAGSDDPMRSSDGGAISLFRWSKADVEHNIILSNRALNHNDAGGIWIALWTSATVKNNVIVDNEADDDAGGIFVGGQEHRYDRPLDKMPAPDSFFVDIEQNTIIGNRNRSMNSGAIRFTMESRGLFKNNITAHNNGVYFQRSEAKIVGNVILDNFLLVETKKYLGEYIVADNLFGAGYDQRIAAKVTRNNMLHPPKGTDNYWRVPRFADDGVTLKVASSNYFPQNYYTEMFLFNTKMRPNELANRVVKIGDRWSVVRSNSETSVALWGNFTGEVAMTVLPTYRLRGK